MDYSVGSSISICNRVFLRQDPKPTLSHHSPLEYGPNTVCAALLGVLPDRNSHSLRILVAIDRGFAREVQES